MSFVFNQKTGICPRQTTKLSPMSEWNREKMTLEKQQVLQKQKSRGFPKTPPPSPEKMDTTEDPSLVQEISQTKHEASQRRKSGREALKQRKRKFKAMNASKPQQAKKKFFIVIKPTKTTMYASKFAKPGELTGFVYLKSDGCLVQAETKWRKISSEVSIRGAVCPALQLELIKATVAKTSMKVLVTRGPEEEEIPTFVLEKHVPLTV